MNENVVTWLAALRSGKYEQGTGYLHTVARQEGESDKFCCLGVACVLYNEANPNTPLPVEERHGVVMYDENASYLPEPVAEWLGMKRENHLGRVANGNSLASVNDARTPFPEVADYIEAHADGLFTA